MIKKQKRATRVLNCLVDWDVKHVSKDASGKMIIKGFANTADKDRIGDVVLPSAFVKSLPEYLDNPVILFQHNWDKVIGKCIKADIVSEGDTQGLYIEAEISAAKDVEEVKTKIAEGILKTFSIGYNELDAELDEGSGVNVVKELELLEISVVTIPCNPKAKFTSETEEVKTEKDAGEMDLIGLFEYMADSIKELESIDDIDGDFLSELSDIYLKGGPGSGRRGEGGGKPSGSGGSISARIEADNAKVGAKAEKLSDKADKKIDDAKATLGKVKDKDKKANLQRALDHATSVSVEHYDAMRAHNSKPTSQTRSNLEKVNDKLNTAIESLDYQIGASQLKP